MMEKKQYFSPQNLRKEKLYHANFLLEISEEERAKVEFLSLNFVQKFSLLELLKVPQNRYWLYKKYPFVNSNLYPFRLKSFDKQTKTFSFSPPKRKLLSASSVKQIISSRNELNLQKSRMVSLYSKGWKCFLNGGLKKIHFKKVKRKKTFLKGLRKKRQKIQLLSRKRRLFFSISSYGMITNLKAMLKLSFRKKKFKRKKKARRFIKYPSSRKMMKVMVLNFLRKNKKDVLKKLIRKKI